jgi:hypothetical protein
MGRTLLYVIVAALFPVVASLATAHDHAHV